MEPIYPPVPEPSVPLTKTGEGLPPAPGIYFFWGRQSGQVDYVGQTRKLCKRAVSRHFEARAGDQVSWLEFPQADLNFAEAFYIGTLRPARNGNIALHLSGGRQSAEKHATVRAGYRTGDGKPVFTVTWHPLPGCRKRRSFSSIAEAEQEAARIDDLMAHGNGVLADYSKEQLRALVMLLSQIPNVEPIEIVQHYLLARKTTISGATLAQIGTDYIKSRESEKDFSLRHRQTVRVHVNRAIKVFGPRQPAAITTAEWQNYISEIGNSGKTRQQHLITLKALCRWARDTDGCFEHGKPLPVELVPMPKYSKSEHELYSPEEFLRLLVFAPGDMVIWMVLGQFAGIRADERLRLHWRHWRAEEDNKIVCDESVTKTNKRRRVDVLDNLDAWLAAFHEKPDEPMVPRRNPHKLTPALARESGVPWKDNALRAGYASYHLELFDNAALTAKNDGHTVAELECTYRSIEGVTKAKAKEMFSITPESVLEFARAANLPEPGWARKIMVAST